MKKTLTSLVLALIACGCAHPQPPPSSNPVIGWTWTLGAAVNGAPVESTWTTTLYTATVASLTSTCPVPGGSAYSSVGTTAGNVGTFSQSNATPGSIICAITQNSFVVASVPYYSPYSPASAPFQVPPLPTAPGLPAPTVTSAILDTPVNHESPHAPTMARITLPTPGQVQLRVMEALF